MNKKVKIITTWLAATVFLFALAINVKVTLEDPFMLLSDEAIASTTSGSSTTTGTPVKTDEVITQSSSKTVKEELVPGVCREKTVTTTIITCSESPGTIDCTPGSNITNGDWTFVDCN